MHFQNKSVWILPVEITMVKKRRIYSYFHPPGQFKLLSSCETHPQITVGAEWGLLYWETGSKLVIFRVDLRKFNPLRSVMGLRTKWRSGFVVKNPDRVGFQPVLSWDSHPSTIHIPSLPVTKQKGFRYYIFYFQKGRLPRIFESPSIYYTFTSTLKGDIHISLILTSQSIHLSPQVTMLC